MSKQALIIIDLQNDYFAAGRYPQWQAEQTLAACKQAAEQAQAAGDLVIFVQHVATAEAPIFTPGSQGVELHPELAELSKDAPIVQKQHADSFLDTNLAQVLNQHQVEQIVLAGMMTQNCITHTALSEAATPYAVTVLISACTGPDAMVHGFAAKALANRVTITTAYSE